MIHGLYRDLGRGLGRAIPRERLPLKYIRLLFWILRK